MRFKEVVTILSVEDKTIGKTPEVDATVYQQIGGVVKKYIVRLVGEDAEKIKKGVGYTIVGSFSVMQSDKSLSGVLLENIEIVRKKTEGFSDRVYEQHHY